MCFGTAAIIIRILNTVTLTCFTTRIGVTFVIVGVCLQVVLHYLSTTFGIIRSGNNVTFALTCITILFVILSECLVALTALVKLTIWAFNSITVTTHCIIIQWSWFHLSLTTSIHLFLIGSWTLIIFSIELLTAIIFTWLLWEWLFTLVCQNTVFRSACFWTHLFSSFTATCLS